VRKLSLTTTFALVSLAAMAVLGVALVIASQRLLQGQALTQARYTAEAYVRVGVQAVTEPEMFAPGRLPAPVVAELDGILRSDQGSALRTVRLWSDDGSVIYDSACPECLAGDNPGVSGIPDLRFEEVMRAGGSDSVAALVDEVAADGRAERRLDVYVPVAFPGESRPSGMAEVVLTYDDTAAAVAQGVRTIALVVLAGLAVLWLLLFRTVRQASRRLRFQAAENARLALLDPLTGLPNRRLLNDRLERAAAVATRTGLHVGLVLLDIDRFKEVNDTLGHPRGDALLKVVAERLRGTARDADTVARLGGDEFAILLPTVGSVEDAEAFTRRVQSEVFDEPFDIDGLVLHVDTSIGLAVLPEHADDVTDLMARADVAMYTAKAAGIGIATYSAAVDGNSESRLTLLGDLRRALDTDDQLVMHYQPKVDLRTGRVVGLEALLRWWHPVQGLVAPNEFIPVAEQTGLMHQLTARVLGLVASQIAVWQREGEVLPVAVNLSARNLLEPNLDEVVAALLDMHQISPHLLEFEITESAIVEDPRRAGEMLRRLSAMGIAVAVDDFGIGNTSMGQLRSMPLNTIKIDASFVTNLGHDEAGGVLVRAIVDLAHEFGLVAVAEGVEDEAAIARLRDLDCDVAQGFHWSRPVPAAELPAVLERIRTQPTVGGAPVRS
jgi:diguanylate cyclase (GGDEF)-like protein